MEIKYIRVKELFTYIASDEFAHQPIIPISGLRAISQAHNPSADPDDYALLLSMEQGEIIGYIGILPCSVYLLGKKHKVYSNTGWWVHPEKGRKSAMQLFYRMIQICGDTLFFADLTPHTTSIVKATNLFKIPEPKTGLKIIYKFSFYTMLPRKYPKLNYFKPIWKLSDSFLNIIVLPLTKKRKFVVDTNIKLLKIENIDTETAEFIDSFSGENIQFRKQTELDWILKYPWLRVSDNEKDEESKKYYFSTICKEFTNHCYKIYRDDELIGFVMLTSRNREFKMPYYFSKSSDSDIIFKVVDNLLFTLGAVSFTTWQSAYLSYFVMNAHFFLYKKRLHKQEAFSKEFPGIDNGMVALQDGDADMAFT